jgi:sterol desaturase/sphingolipid hydroxylase (fatty acid hydroxylase superfamily)
MEAIIEYFDNISSFHRTIILFGGLTFFLLIENVAPFFQFKNNKVKHVGLNLFFTLTTILVNFVFAFILIAASNYVDTNQFGIIQFAPLNLVLFTVLGVMLLDLLGAWLAHWTEHHVKWMWQFHLIHHTDMHLDASSANRHHPGESVIRFLFTLLAVVIVGAPVWMVLLYQAMSVTLSQFNHSNINMPKWLDTGISWLFVTPDMHRVHHHYRQPYSDSNYGNIFSIWDKIFQTFQKVDNRKLVYGLDTHMEKDNVDKVGFLLKAPFVGYREQIKYTKEEKL